MCDYYTRPIMGVNRIFWNQMCDTLVSERLSFVRCCDDKRLLKLFAKKDKSVRVRRLAEKRLETGKNLI